MRNTFNNMRGVTLIELLVVIGILGILTSLAYVGFEIVRRERLTSATKELVADIQQARVNALISNPTGTAIRGFGIRFESASYTLFTFDDVNTNFSYDGTTEEKYTDARPLSTQVSISRILGGAPDTLYPVLIFTRTGVPSLYKTTGAAYPAPVSLILVLSVQSLNDMKCVEVNSNSIREGVLSGALCTK